MPHQTGPDALRTGMRCQAAEHTSDASPFQGTVHPVRIHASRTDQRSLHVWHRPCTPPIRYGLTRDQLLEVEEQLEEIRQRRSQLTDDFTAIGSAPLLGELRRWKWGAACARPHRVLGAALGGPVGRDGCILLPSTAPA